MSAALRTRFAQIRKPGHTGRDYDAFTAQLIASNAPARLAFHWSLIAQRTRLNRPLYKALCFAFRDRDRAGEAFLAARARREQRPELRAEALRILSLTRSKIAGAVAIAMCVSDDPIDRLAAYQALGFLAPTNDHLDALLGQLAVETRSALRKELASTIDWIARGLGAAARKRAVRGLVAKLRTETRTQVIAELVLALQYLVGKSFGLREVISTDVERVGIRGDVGAAKLRALRAR